MLVHVIFQVECSLLFFRWVPALHELRSLHVLWSLLHVYVWACRNVSIGCLFTLISAQTFKTLSTVVHWQVTRRCFTLAQNGFSYWMNWWIPFCLTKSFKTKRKESAAMYLWNNSHYESTTSPYCFSEVLASQNQSITGAKMRAQVQWELRS